MKVTSEFSQTDATYAGTQGRLTWRRLVLVAGVVAALAIGFVSAVLGDLEGGVVTAGFAVATSLTRVRKGILGSLALALVSAITLVFMLTAAVTNIRAGSALGAIVVSSGLAAISLLALTAALGYLLVRGRTPTTGPWVLVAVASVSLIGLIGSGIATSPATGGSADIHLVSENVAFSESELTTTAGEITVALENRDLFWHTFTIEELGIDLRVPVGAELHVTFDVRPGEYRFICAVPGHPEAGMVGTLRVEE